VAPRLGLQTEIASGFFLVEIDTGCGATHQSFTSSIHFSCLSERSFSVADMPKINESDVPPPSFPVLVSMFSSQAAMALGLIENPVTKKSSIELPLARHFIGMLTVLEEKTKGNLSDEESSFLDRSLHQLRISFVQAEKSAK